MHHYLFSQSLQARGQMSAGANQRPPLSDLPPSINLKYYL
jgi:hypothetical protein